MSDAKIDVTKHDAIKAAEGLCYGGEVVRKLKRAKSINEVGIIMATEMKRRTAIEDRINDERIMLERAKRSKKR